MKIWYLAAAFVLSAGALRATFVLPTPLDERVAEASIIVVGKVTEVKMKGWLGLPAFDEDAWVGPGSRYTLWTKVEFDRAAVLKGDPSLIPSSKWFPIWQGWVKTLGSEREATIGKNFIFFLSDDLDQTDFREWDFPETRSEIEEEIQVQKEKPIQSPQPTAVNRRG
jgi:hypothetical protein